MKYRNDLTGKTFGRLTVTHHIKSEGGHQHWQCTCSCGGSKVALANNLQRGLTQSCGCLHKESVTKHGQCKAPGYMSWKSMHSRCGVNGTPQECYKNISICERWNDVNLFLADMGPPPSSNHTIDRRDNDGDYNPENCRWATKQQQSNNRGNNVWLTYHDKTLTMAEWSREMSWPPNIIKSRHAAGWSTERILETPVREYRRAAD